MFQVSAPDVLIMNCPVILAITASFQSPEPPPSLQGCTLTPWVPLAEHTGYKGLSPLRGTKAEQQEPLPGSAGSSAFNQPQGPGCQSTESPGSPQEQPVHPFTCKESAVTANGMWAAAAEPGIKTQLLWLNLPECDKCCLNRVGGKDLTPSDFHNQHVIKELKQKHLSGKPLAKIQLKA